MQALISRGAGPPMRRGLAEKVRRLRERGLDIDRLWELIGGSANYVIVIMRALLLRIISGGRTPIDGQVSLIQIVFRGNAQTNLLTVYLRRLAIMVRQSASQIAIHMRYPIDPKGRLPDGGRLIDGGRLVDGGRLTDGGHAQWLISDRASTWLRIICTVRNAFAPPQLVCTVRVGASPWALLL